MMPVLLVVMLFASVIAQPATTPDYPDRLTIQVFTPCSGTAKFCWPVVLLRGVIDSDSPKRVSDYFESGKGVETIAFDSPGGNLLAGLKIGEFIRERHYDTLVSSEYSEEQAGGGSRLISKNAICMSACAYAFMGGVGRTVEDHGMIGVHQFAYESKKNSPGSDAQVATAVLSQYVKDMGVDRDVLDVASLTASTEIATIDRKAARRLNLDNQSPVDAPWQLKALAGGMLTLAVEQQRPGSDSRTRIALAKPDATNRVLVLIEYDLSFDGRTRDEIIESGTTGDIGREQICSRENYSDCISLTRITHWEVVAGNRFHALYAVSDSDIAGLAARSTGFTISSAFPHAYEDIAPDVHLGIAGFKDGFIALIH